MDSKTAKNIGSQLAVKSVSIGLAIGYIIMIPLSGKGQDNSGNRLFWIVDWMRSEFALHIIFAIAAFYACGYYFGAKAGNAIVIKQRNHSWIGMQYGFLTLFTTVFITSLIGFVQGIIHDLHYVDSFTDMRLDMFSDNFLDYIIKPLFWFLFFGLIPVLLVGLWFGWGIKRKAELHKEE